MKISLIQYKPSKGDVDLNIKRHLKWIEKATKEDVDLIAFPELSLTGYEPSLAKNLALEIHDARLQIFSKKAQEYNTIIIIGYPLKTKHGITIAMGIFYSDGSMDTYSKQYLHKDEKQFFVGGHDTKIIRIGRWTIGLAICYESLQKEHFDSCLNNNVNLYLVSVCKHKDGIKKAVKYYETLSKENLTPVLMVNSVGKCDNFLSAGYSSFWNRRGLLQSKLGKSQEGILHCVID